VALSQFLQNLRVRVAPIRFGHVAMSEQVVESRDMGASEMIAQITGGEADGMVQALHQRMKQDNLMRGRVLRGSDKEKPGVSQAFSNFLD
jgi:hypothetical protein